MERELKIAVAGGDLRQCALAELLIQEGFSVSACGLGENDLPNISVPLNELSHSDVVALPPIPFTPEKTLNTPRASKSFAMSELFSVVREGTLLFAGTFSMEVREIAVSRGIRLATYLDREDFAIGNAALTADAALVVAMTESMRPFAFRKCLVSGFGKIGKLLALKLKALGAEVSVSARRGTDLAWIEAMGFTPVKTGKWGKTLSEAELIFNTVPAPIFTESDAVKMQDSALFFELASLPGGLSGPALDALKARRVPALGLPGRFFPGNAAKILCDTLLRILNETEGHQ